MCNFGLSAEDTYTPPLHVGRNLSHSALTNSTRSLAKLAHADPYTHDRLLPLPRSVSQQRLGTIPALVVYSHVFAHSHIHTHIHTYIYMHELHELV